MSDDLVERMILMPRRGLRAHASQLSAGAARRLEEFDGLIGSSAIGVVARGVRCRVLDSIRGDGPKLIELARGDIPTMRAAYPDLDLVPVVYYELAMAPQSLAISPPPGAGGVGAAAPIRVSIVDAASGAPVPGARLVAWTNFPVSGLNAVSGADGIGAFNFNADTVALERLYVYPPLAGSWGHYRRDFELADGLTIKLPPIDLTWIDSLRHFYPIGNMDVGAGVTVGIIDGGVGPHPHLVCDGDLDNGSGHGTHVAGIIAGRGEAPEGIGGLAPGVKLHSYRVFGEPGGLAANFTIAKAIDTALLEHKCDLINLSIEGRGGEDPLVRTALEDAREAGVLPIAAAGNRLRQPVEFPARDSMCIAVSALGRKGTFPDESVETADVVEPFGQDSSDFIAAFSNVGMEIDLTAPGSGVISTVPGGYGVMSGTSMACPAVTGIAARLLARDQELMTMDRGSERSARLAQRVLETAVSLGFSADLQGAGLLQEQGEA
jgi:subtilisin